MTHTAIGIDLGGTNLRVCLVDEGGTRLAEHREPVPKGASAEDLLRRVGEQARAVCGAASPEGIGLAVAGALDMRDRIVAGMTNLPVLAGRDIIRELEALAGLPVSLENDARAAMAGEARFGRARGVANALTITLGTGIGGGLLLDGGLRGGGRRLAGEIGLALVAERHAARGWIALEDAASPGGLARTRGLDLASVSAGAAAGNCEAQRVLSEVAELVAVGIVNAHVLLDLELVLLSGGLMRAGAPFIEGVREAFDRLCPPAFKGLPIEIAGLGEWAGAMGAAALSLPGHRPRTTAGQRGAHES